MRLSPSLPLFAAALLAAGCGTHVPLMPSGSTSSPAKPAAPAAKAAAAPAAANPWASVQAQVGRKPSEGTDFLRTGPMGVRVKELLGPVNHPEFLKNMAVSTPLRQEGGLLYITGRRSNQPDAQAAAVVVDPSRDAMRVWLQTGDEEWDVQDAGAPVPLPADVRKVLEDARR
ncbi:hypothetical protein AVKW3434_23015 [Acidovorax sp. SUPP3434]|uniref:hypothetical protein n=1 Tax=Acidovorax sp. SUPP3434 TaxID=2920880 RepID=UPI0023DE2EE5|nr:hypothetical protein [Acidovorax sp. SUPP3434]GKT02314.1 hypothetical protein AVKW3434_23015 [Acidovorax sp. SUPP3434]